MKRITTETILDRATQGQTEAAILVWRRDPSFSIQYSKASRVLSGVTLIEHSHMVTPT
jgi:hypothetical protein